MIELIVSLILFTIAMLLASVAFRGYQTRTAAQRSAQVFAVDLTYARTRAVRGREAVILHFDEAGMSYLVRLESGDTLLEREFGRDDDIPLDYLNLALAGDSLVFDTRGDSEIRIALGRSRDDTRALRHCRTLDGETLPGAQYGILPHVLSSVSSILLRSNFWQ